MSDSSSSSGSESKMITGKDAEALMENFQWSIDEACILKDLLKKGDANFLARYNGLVKQLYDDKSTFEDFLAKFSESNYAEEIQKLQEEAQSKFDDLTQLKQKKEEKKEAERLKTNFLVNIDEVPKIKDLLEKGDANFRTRYNLLRIWLNRDKSSFAIFLTKFPESNHAEEIPKLQERAQKEFDDLTQLKEEKEEAERLKTKIRSNIDDVPKIKDLLKKGDANFQFRYNLLRIWLYGHKSSFEIFLTKFPESNDAEEIRALKEEAQSKFDDLKQHKEKKEEEEAERLKTNFQSYIDDVPKIKELLEKGDDAFQSRYDQLRNYLDDDKSSFKNFRALFPESNDAEEIQKLQEEAQSKFDDLTQLKKEKEARSNLSLSSAFHTMLFGAVITLIGVYMVTGAQSDFLLIMIMVLTGLTFGIMLKRLLCC